MVSRKEISTVVPVLFVAVICLVSGQTCTIGRNDESEQGVRTDQRFYLDVNNPATCNGTITNWRVCYYGRSEGQAFEFHSYWATYAVYRRMGSGGGESYVKVSELFRAVRTTTGRGDGVDGRNRLGFNCYTDSIDAGDSPLTIRAGDIIGACVFNPQDADSFDRQQLNIVGEVPSGLGESLMRIDVGDRSNQVDCTMDDIPSSIQQGDLGNQNNRRLHIYANIEPAPEPVPPTAPVTTTDIQDETTQADNQGGNDEGSNESSSPGDLGPGAIVGIIIVLLVVMVMGVVVAVVVALFLVRRRKTGLGDKYSMARNDIGLDNLTYGIGKDTANNGQIPSLETGVYEVPVNISASAGAVTQDAKTEPEYEITESTYAIPHVYEYATLGPNEQKDDSSGQYYSPLDEATISYAKLLEKNKQEDIYGSVDEYLQPATAENELYAQIKACGIKNISSNLIQINGHLGSGQFGSVERGLWKDGTRSIPIAVKLLKEGATEMDKVKFLQEAAIMAQFRHPNVVSLYGVVSKTEPLMLVVELIERGNLREYLHTMRPDPGQLPAAAIPQLLLTFSQQVALGMHYLSAKRFIHRDLAARNILVSKDNICKVADFGMSRDLANDTYYVSQGGQVPVKWTAPEAIHYKKYSTASDVWSYGCLLYEIWSLGYKPFEGTINAKVIRLVDSGQRLSPPPGCSRAIYELMIKCWNPVAADRPGFREIFLSLLDTPENVLSIPPEALDSHPLAGVIGSPLEVGENMYTDLRDRYLITDHT